MKKLLFIISVLVASGSFGQKMKSSVILKMLAGVYQVTEVSDLDNNVTIYSLQMRSIEYMEIDEYFTAIKAESIDELIQKIQEWHDFAVENEVGVFEVFDEYRLSKVKEMGFIGVRVSMNNRSDHYCEINTKSMEKMIKKLKKITS